MLDRLVGPPEIQAQIAGQNPKAPFLWRRPSKWRDAGDLPSARYMRAFLAHAAATGRPLTAEHLVWGAPAEEIDALLARPQFTHREAAE